MNLRRVRSVVGLWCSALCQRPTALVRTTMSPSLPPETLDAIIDLLHDEPTTLKSCCAVSKSWVPRTRRHLFSHVEFHNAKSHLEVWKKAFPDPSNSPAHHARTLSVYGATDADAGVDDWLRAFHNVEHLLLARTDRSPLVSFYALSPAVRSLHLTHTTTDVFDLICSFPLLENLVLLDLHPGSEADLQLVSEAGGWNAPSKSPKLTGSLDLRMNWGLDSIAHRLCALPNGLRFTKIIVGFGIGDIDPIMDLVSKCSDTLESLTVGCFIMLGMFPSASVIDQYLTAARGCRNAKGAFH